MEKKRQDGVKDEPGTSKEKNSDVDSASGPESKRESPAFPCPIHSLLSTPLSERNPIEVKRILANVRGPQPSQMRIISNKPSAWRRLSAHISDFDCSYFEKFEWLCGCFSGSLFCWPCLCLAKRHPCNVWVTSGYADVDNIMNAALKHSATQAHIHAVSCYKSISAAPVHKLIDLLRKEEILAHNKQVTVNKEILKRLTGAVCFLIRGELAITREEIEQTTILISLAYVVAEFDPVLAEHSEALSLMYRDVRSDLIDTLHAMTLNRLRSEINEAHFVAIMVSQIASHGIATVVRYVDSECEVQERFLGFTHLKDRSAATLAEHVRNVVTRLGCESKVVSQTYDGSIVTPDCLAETQRRVKEAFPCALLANFLKPGFNEVLCQSIELKLQLYLFFGMLQNIGKFFSRPDRLRFLNTMTHNHLAGSWDFGNNLLRTIRNYRTDLIDTLDEMLDDWSAPVYAADLTKFENVFLLILFDKVFEATAAVSDMPVDISDCLERIDLTKGLLRNLRNDFFPELMAETERLVGQPSSPETRYPTLFNEIIDACLEYVDLRFTDISKLQFLELLVRKKRPSYRRNFPSAKCETLQSIFPGKFNVPKLKTELSILYRLRNYRSICPRTVLLAFLQNGTSEVMTEVFKLCQLALTLPSTSTGKSVSALERIKKYEEYDLDDPRLTFLTIENSLLYEMDTGPEFCASVVDEFVSKTRREDFLYK